MTSDQPVPELPSCPECGAHATMPIMYGFPTPETVEAVQRGELRVVIGGCGVDDSNPSWACPDCKSRW